MNNLNDQTNNLSLPVNKDVSATIPPTEPSPGSTEMLSLDSMIKTSLSRIEILKKELKQNRDMFEDALKNNAVYQEHLKTVQEATKAKNASRKEILSQPVLVELAAKIKEMKADLKGMQDSLSDYLERYAKATGLTQIETDQGEVLDIVTVTKLVRRSAPTKPNQ